VPTIVPNALGEASAILGNNFDASNKPSLVFIDTSDSRFSTVIEKYSNIPNKIRPKEPLPSKKFEARSGSLQLQNWGLLVSQ
jgi:hypothetical protein